MGQHAQIYKSSGLKNATTNPAVKKYRLDWILCEIGNIESNGFDNIRLDWPINPVNRTGFSFFQSSAKITRTEIWGVESSGFVQSIGLTQKTWLPNKPLEKPEWDPQWVHNLSTWRKHLHETRQSRKYRFPFIFIYKKIIKK